MRHYSISCKIWSLWSCTAELHTYSNATWYLLSHSNPVTENAYLVPVCVPRNVKARITPSSIPGTLVHSRIVRLSKDRSRFLKRPSTVSRRYILITRLESATSPWIRVSSKYFPHWKKSRVTLTSKRHTLISPICHTSGEHLHNNSDTPRSEREKKTFSNYMNKESSLQALFYEHN